MGSPQKPYLSEDGDHVFPVVATRRLPMGDQREAVGEVRWNHRNGISFKFEVPAESLSELSLSSPALPGGAGAMYSISQQPEWVASLPNGTDISLYGVNERHVGTMTYGTDGSSMSRVFQGSAKYAKVTLGRDDELSFWNQTAVTDRLYAVGLDMSKWPSEEDVRWKNDEGLLLFSRAWIDLNSSLRLVRASISPPDEKAVWLTYTTDGTADEFWVDESCQHVKAFMSFLVGRATPFLWKDTFSSDDRLTRLYMLGHGRRNPIQGIEQPFPLGRSVEMSRYWPDVVRQLPAMFERFVELRESYDVEWIASPIWYAYDGYVDDKLALACISLERLATAHNSYLKRSGNATKGRPFLNPDVYNDLRRAMSEALQAVAAKHDLTDDLKNVISRKVDGMNQPPNRDKLSAMFSYFGISLTGSEREVLNHRNFSLHGRRTIGDASLVDAVAEEVLRFDTMRTLINRALLGVLGYAGPYADYSARPSEGDFPLGFIGK